MARRTIPGAIEVLLSCLYVSGLQVGDLDAAAMTVIRLGLRLLRMDEGDQTRQFLIGKFEARHPFFRTPIPHDCVNCASRNILGHQFGLRQIWACLSALRIASMAEGAVLLEQCAASFRLGRRTSWDTRSARLDFSGRSGRSRIDGFPCCRIREDHYDRCQKENCS